MKNRLLFLILIFSSSFSFSQLMRSEVYDFSVGDYFGIEHKSRGYMTGFMTVRYQMFHILSKQLSVTSDSVAYVAERQTYTPQLPNGNGGSYPSTYAIDSFSFSHYQLNQPYSPFIEDRLFGNSVEYFWFNDTNECYTSVNTLNPSPLCFNNSGQMVNFGMHINQPDSCGIEPFMSDYLAYSHAGGPYGGRDCIGDPTFQPIIRNLIFVAHNGVGCGEYPSFFVNVNEPLPELELSAHPNPAKNIISISGVKVLESIHITSSDGRNVTNEVSQNGFQIDISGLSSGVYTLRGIDETGKFGLIRFVKE